jgi:hypothetical protein
MGGADDRPFGAHLFYASHQELAEAATLLDLSEHRLGQLLTQPEGAVVKPPVLIFSRMASTRVGISLVCGEIVAAVALVALAASPLAVPATASLARPVAT